MDANNLYGHCMREKLPHRNFEWSEPGDLLYQELSADLLNGEPHNFEECVGAIQYAHYDSLGYIAEVDLHIPEHVKNMLDDFPLAPENRVVNTNELSGIQASQFRTMYSKFPEEAGSARFNSKLVADVNDKKNYVIHHRYLAFLVKLGCVVTKVHKFLIFEETAFMNDWVETCTRERALARERGDEASANFWKLAANAVYGKFIEDVEKYKDYKLCIGDAEEHLKHTSNHLWESSLYVNSNTSIVS